MQGKKKWGGGGERKKRKEEVRDEKTYSRMLPFLNILKKCMPRNSLQ